MKRYSILACGVMVLWGSLHGAVPERQYEPIRQVDVQHLRIDVTPDFTQRTVTGVVNIRFTTLGLPVAELALDAVALDVNEVTSTLPLFGWTADDERIVLTFTEPLPPGTEGTVKIRYRAEPQEGLYFRTPELGYRSENMHLFSQGESHEARHWFPCYDYPNDRFTSEVICRVSPDLTVVSNGRLVSEAVDKQTGLKASHWLQDKPHVSYLIALAAGRFTKIGETYRDIPLGFYVPTTYAEVAACSFEGTADMMAFFEEEIGVPYPWDKYDQVVTEDFVAGGMENTSLTILTHRTLFPADVGRLGNSVPLVAHELVHQWFGDYVTCKDWTNLWLNEGFATYYEDLYSGHRHGQEEFLYNMYNSARRLLGRRSDQPPIYHREFKSPDEQFDMRAYQKGGWVLHMLRCQLGETLFRECIRTYVERHALDFVETADLRKVIEEKTGRSWIRFFDQWVYFAATPKLKVRYQWSGKDRLAHVTIAQTPSQDKQAMRFEMPATLRFVCDGVPIDKEIRIEEETHEFYFVLPSEPMIVRFDPALTLLADVDFDKSKKQLYAQLENQNDVVGQLRALQDLRESKDKKTIGRIQQQLNQADFYGVRVKAADCLGAIHTDEAFTALLDSCMQEDERVRENVFQALGGYYRQQSLDSMLKQVAREENPRIATSLLRSLGRYHGPEVNYLLLTKLEESSFQNRMAEAVVEALHQHERTDAEFIEPLYRSVRQRQGDYTASGLSMALETLGRLGHSLAEKQEIRDLLTNYVNDPRRRVQTGALKGLGALGDTMAIPVLNAFTAGEVPAYRRGLARTAEEALKTLRQEKPLVADEVIQLRERITELDKNTLKLQETLEALEKRLDAYGAPNEPSPSVDPNEAES